MFINSLPKTFLFSVTMVFVILFSLSDVYAQQSGQKFFQIEPEKYHDSNIISTKHPGQDILVINSSFPELTITSSAGFLDDNSRPGFGVYEFVLNPDRQVITVEQSGYATQTFSIPEKQTQKSHLYTVNITSADDFDESIATILIKPEPSDATVFINNVEQDYRGFITWPTGPAAIRIEKDGYETIQDEVVFTTQSKFFIYPLNESGEMSEDERLSEAFGRSVSFQSSTGSTGAGAGSSESNSDNSASTVTSNDDRFDGLKDMKVEVMDAPATIPVFRDYPDNGVLIIESKLANVRFSSSVGFEHDLSEPYNGIYRYILKPYKQTITAVLSGYRMLRFSIPEVQPREAVYYSVSSASPSGGNASEVSVKFLIKPNSADLYINDVRQNHQNALTLPPGNVSVRVEEPGMKPIEDNITVTPQNNFFEYTLEEIGQEIVTIKTNPSDATIAINDVEKDRKQFFLFPGEYTVRITKSGYATISTTIEVTSGGNNEFTYNLNSSVAKLLLRVSPSDAQILINNRSYPNNKEIILSPGQHLLTVNKDGYAEHRERLSLSENEQLTRRVQLSQNSGSLLFAITPPSADIILRNGSGDIVKRWSGLKKFDQISAGTYMVTATAEGYEELEEEIIIKPNESQMYDFMMSVLSESDKISNDEVFVIVENQPEVIGASSVQQALAKHLVYPTIARRAGIEGRVIVQFIVDKSGSVRNPNVIRGIGGGCDDAALDAIKKLRFRPGTQRGEAVLVKMTAPVVFRLSN